MSLWQDLEIFPFWGVVSQWAQEQSLHEHLVARALARGVVHDGLRVQSVDHPPSGPAKSEVQGEPLVAYVANGGELPIFIRQSALSHLMAVAVRAAVPDRQILQGEFVRRQDFLDWLAQRPFSAPHFGFVAAAGAAAPGKTARRLRTPGNAQVCFVGHAVMKPQHIAGALRAFHHICKKLLAPS